MVSVMSSNLCIIHSKLVTECLHICILLYVALSSVSKFYSYVKYFYYSLIYVRAHYVLVHLRLNGYFNIKDYLNNVYCTQGYNTTAATCRIVGYITTKPV